MPILPAQAQAFRSFTQTEAPLTGWEAAGQALTKMQEGRLEREKEERESLMKAFQALAPIGATEPAQAGEPGAFQLGRSKDSPAFRFTKPGPSGADVKNLLQAQGLKYDLGLEEAPEGYWERKAAETVTKAFGSSLPFTSGVDIEQSHEYLINSLASKLRNAGKLGLSKEDQAAYRWALQNLKDPRAQQTIQVLKKKYGDKLK